MSGTDEAADVRPEEPRPRDGSGRPPGDGDRTPRESRIRSVEYDALEPAQDTANHPDRGTGGRFRLADLPRAPRLSRLVGPSAIMLGASLGSGETLFWPTLVAQYGWAVYWAFWIGVLTQFVVNTEIQRWTLATGESVFRAFERVNVGWLPLLLAFGFLHLGWPGWAAGAAQVLAVGLGIGADRWPALAVGLMLVILLSYLARPVLYDAIERTQVALMVVATAAAVLLVVAVGSWPQLRFVPGGAANVGALPARMDVAVFLGGLAYAGAGGFINLSQSLWVREKGYGMGLYQGRVKNPLRGAVPERVYEDGFTFPPTEAQLRRWRDWWRVAQAEHFLTFVVGLLVVATIMMTVAAEHAAGTTRGAIDMWLLEVVPAIGPLAGGLLTVVLFVALFTTQYAIVEVFVRNSADVLYELYGRDAGWSLDRLFLGLLVGFTAWGVLVVAARLQQPWLLLVLGAAVAGVMMWPYIALVTIVNATRLPEHLQPGWPRLVAMWWATGFFGYFSTLLVGDALVVHAGLPAFATAVGVAGSGVGGYALWLVAGAVQAYTMVRSARGKLATRGTVAGARAAGGFLR